MNVCMYACMYVCVYMHVSVCMQSHDHTCAGGKGRIEEQHAHRGVWGYGPGDFILCCFHQCWRRPRTPQPQCGSPHIPTYIHHTITTITPLIHMRTYLHSSRYVASLFPGLPPASLWLTTALTGACTHITVSVHVLCHDKCQHLG